jgi:hypothetical protein
VNRPTDDAAVPSRWLLSLNWVIRLASPKPVMHSSTHESRACSGTWLCTKIVLRSGSTPRAIICAAADRVFWRSSAGSCGSVIACRSTTQ